MASRHYPHNEAHGLTGTFPAGEQDSQAPDFTATGANTLRGMNRAVGALMTNQSASTLASVSNQAGFIGFWTTAPLSGAQTIGGAGESLSINLGAYESNLGANLDFRFHVYVWRPSTGALVGDCCTFSTAPSNATAEPTAAASIQVATAVVDLAGVSASDGDVIIVEVWTNTTQAAASSFTVQMYYDGTVENATEGTVVTDHAAYVEFSQNLTFQSPEARLTGASSTVFFESSDVSEARLTGASSTVFFESSDVSEARLTGASAVVWYLALTPRPGLFLDASGQLVIAPAIQPGWSIVYDAPSANLDDVALWYRNLDSQSAANWHPGNYYDEGPEKTWPWAVTVKNGAYGEQQQISASNETYDTGIVVSTGVLSIITSLAFTSILSPERMRKILVFFTCEATASVTKVVVSVTSGAYTADKVLFDLSTQTDSHMLTFSAIVSVPAGYVADIVLDIKVRHNYGSNRTFNEINLSALELP